MYESDSLKEKLHLKFSEVDFVSKFLFVVVGSLLLLLLLLLYV